MKIKARIMLCKINTSIIQKQRLNRTNWEFPLSLLAGSATLLSYVMLMKLQIYDFILGIPQKICEHLRDVKENGLRSMLKIK